MTEEYDSRAIDWSQTFVLMLEEARRAADGQVVALEALRGRAGGLIGYSGALAAVFVGVSQSEEWTTWAGLIAFGIVAIFAGVILAPITLDIDMNPNKIRAYLEQAKSVDHIIDSLASAHWSAFEGNRRKVDELHAFYFVALVAFIAEAALFALSVVIH